MFRSPSLLRLAKDQACVMCGTQDRTIVAAHSNLLEHGKGRSIKADDSMTAWLCYRCHSDYDQGTRMSRAERELYIKTAICKTYVALWNQGLIEVKK